MSSALTVRVLYSMSTVLGRVYQRLGGTSGTKMAVRWSVFSTASLQALIVCHIAAISKTCIATSVVVPRRN